MRLRARAADYLGGEEICVGSDVAFAVAAKRDVDVVADEAREGHMPFSPKALDICGEVGEVEVFRDSKSETTGTADRDVGVIGEVTVDLDAEKYYCHNYFNRW